LGSGCYTRLLVFHHIEQRIAQSVAAYLRIRYGIETEVVVEPPKEPRFGELGITSAFALARQLRKAPRVIAAEILAEMPPIEGVASAEIAGNGYINLRLDRAAYGAALLAEDAQTAAPASPGKIIVEHTNINPNKAAHIGHVRNAVLGDTFVRMLRAAGREVEVQNYIDNTGVQVADVVAGFHHLEHKTPEQVAGMAADPACRFDYLCWDLYARTSSYYKDNPDALEWRKQALHAIEAGVGELAELAHIVADAIVACHIKTMLRMGIEYDVLPRESEILHLQFWATAFELLKERKGIYLEAEGKNAGCWVMPGSAFSDSTDEDTNKVIVRSNGTVTYVGKDIAYQLWKFGLLGKDFHYRPWMSYPDGRILWVSTDRPSGGAAPEFGRGSSVYNVIDSRQSYLQDVVAAGLRALGFLEQAGQSIHFSYEMVALTPRTCVELGIELSPEDREKAYVEVSGRKGLGVKADDLIDKLVEKACEEVDSRHPEAPAEERRRVGSEIAVGALRYFMLKFTRNAVIAFDMQEALSFEGETGPYVQYAAVRARNILNKLGERGDRLPIFDRELDAASMGRQLQSEDFWQIVLAISKADSALAHAIASGEPAHVARYAFQLAQVFNSFYHSYPVLQEPDPERRTFLLWMTEYFRRHLESTLGILGITVPQYM
jgi:arginyl-tRNA synthetase